MMLNFIDDTFSHVHLINFLKLSPLGAEHFNAKMDPTDESPRSYKSGLYPVELYLSGDLETRSDIIVNHRDVSSFLSLHDQIVSRAYFPKKVVNYSKQNKGDYKVIAAGTGTLEDYVPFHAPETFILSGHHHLELSPKFHQDIKSTSFSKYVKKHKKNMQVPPRLKKDKDMKNLSILAFPVVLPVLRGQKIIEGNCDDPKVAEAFEENHEFYKTWLELKKGSYIIEEGDLPTEKYPFPETGIYVLQRCELPITIIWKTNTSSQCLQVVKKEIDKLLKKKVQSPLPRHFSAITGSVPHEVALLENNTVVTATSKDTKTVENMSAS